MMSLNLAHPVEIVKILQYICYCSIFYSSNFVVLVCYFSAEHVKHSLLPHIRKSVVLQFDPTSFLS